MLINRLSKVAVHNFERWTPILNLSKSSPLNSSSELGQSSSLVQHLGNHHACFSSTKSSSNQSKNSFVPLRPLADPLTHLYLDSGFFAANFKNKSTLIYKVLLQTFPLAYYGLAAEPSLLLTLLGMTSIFVATQIIDTRRDKEFSRFLFSIEASSDGKYLYFIVPYNSSTPELFHLWQIDRKNSPNLGVWQYTKKMDDLKDIVFGPQKYQNGSGIRFPRQSLSFASLMPSEFKKTHIKQFAKGLDLRGLDQKQVKKAFDLYMADYKFEQDYRRIRVLRSKCTFRTIRELNSQQLKVFNLTEVEDQTIVVAAETKKDNETVYDANKIKNYSRYVINVSFKRKDAQIPPKPASKFSKNQQDSPEGNENCIFAFYPAVNIAYKHQDWLDALIRGTWNETIQK